MHQLEERDRGENVVAGRDNRSGRESPFEPDGEINKSDEERQKNGNDGAALQLLTDARANRFSSLYGERVGAEFLVEDTRYGGGDALCAS